MAEFQPEIISPNTVTIIYQIQLASATRLERLGKEWLKMRLVSQS